jgi:flagellar biosynthesis protein FlhB
MPESSTDEKNEAPTARRIQQARQSGQVAISRDLATALSVAVACVVLVATASAGAAGLLRLMRESLGGATKANAISMAAKSGFEAVLLNIGVPGGALLLAACLVGVTQTQGLATALPLRPDVRRVLPALGRVLGRDQRMEAGKGFLSLCLLFVVAFWSIRPAVSCIASLGGASAARILRTVGVLGQRLAIHLTVVIVTLGAADYLWQRHRHGKALRMSRDEVKREHRQSEGEPAHKAERLRLHHEFMQEVTLGDVTKADFIVVHVHIGVVAAAIRYDEKSSSPPVVLLKGDGGRAQAIAAAARAAGVPAVVDPDLARALGSLDEGGEIPEALYQSVAECLLRTDTIGQTEN